MGNNVFKGNPLTSVVWNPVSCTIGTGDNAPFYGSPSAITSFVFGDSVKSIPGYLCYYLTKLEHIDLPEKLTTIGQHAFYGCSLLQDVEIPTTVTSIASDAFAYCKAIKHFAFPQGIKTVATEVLEGCTALEDVLIPSSVTTINKDAFYGCSGLLAIHNYAYTPQTIVESTVNSVNKKTCILYVPMDYIDLYQAKAVWCDFLNIIGVATDLQFEEQIVNVTYLKNDESLFYMEAQNWQVPHEPRVAGFTFVGWRVLPGMLSEGIVLQAVYESNNPTNAPDIYVNPDNKAQKLIRDGNVYILSDDQVYTIQGQKVR